MGFVVKSGAAMAVAAVTGATVLATPVEKPAPTTTAVRSSTPVQLTASSRTLYPWPLLLAPDGDAGRSAAASGPSAALAASDLDEIDESFIEFRKSVRTDFTAFANDLGYLGRQLYIAFNFGESIVASLVFNGTDIFRGEGILTNLGEIGRDIIESVVFIAYDQLVLATPESDDFELLQRPPRDTPPGWVDARAPEVFLPLPTRGGEEDDAPSGIADDDSASPAEEASLDDVTTDDEDLSARVDADEDLEEPTGTDDESVTDEAAAEDAAAEEVADEGEAAEAEAAEAEAAETESDEAEAEKADADEGSDDAAED